MDKVTSLKNVLGHESIPFVFSERKYRILDRRLCFQVSDSACAACAQMSHMSCWRTSTPSLGPCCPTPMRSWSLRRGWMRLRAWRSRRINPGRKMDYSGISVVIVVVDLLGSVLDRLWYSYSHISKSYPIARSIWSGRVACGFRGEGCWPHDLGSGQVAFHGVWKQSLTELSGGQRSLLALSLVLALLLFKPAPMCRAQCQMLTEMTWPTWGYQWDHGILG